MSRDLHITPYCLMEDNDSFQYCQMDLNIWFENSNVNHVESRYFDSQFLGHSTVKNLLESMTTYLATINSVNLTRLSMFGSNVNVSNKSYLNFLILGVATFM